MAEVFIINEGLEMKTSTSGSKFTVRIISEPVVINTDPLFLAMAPAKRVAAFLRQRVQGVSARAAENTLRARHTALKAFVLGKPWAMKRYSGGRMGSRPPLRSELALNDSGRLAESIRASQSKSTGTWRVDVAANRLDPTTAHSFERVWNRVVQLVPEFGKSIPADIIQEGIKWSMRNMIRKEKATTGKLALGVARELFRVAENVANLLSA